MINLNTNLKKFNKNFINSITKIQKKYKIYFKTLFIPTYLKLNNFPTNFIEKNIYKLLDETYKLHVIDENINENINENILFEKKILDKYNNLSNYHNVGATKLLYEDIIYLMKYNINKNYINLLRKLGLILSLLTYLSCASQDPKYYKIVEYIMETHNISFDILKKYL